MFFDLETLNNTGYDGLLQFIYAMANFAISFSVIIVVIMVVFAGFKYITSGGDEAKVKDATKALAFAIVGLILVFLSPTVIQFVINEILETK